MKYALLLSLLFCSFCGKAQNTDSAQNKIYTYVEQMPEPEYDMTGYLSKHLQYPDSAADNNIQGRVIVKFVVNEDGTISNCKVEKGIGGGCDEEALNTLKNMPRWKPGMHDGQPVKVQTMLPVTFTLTEQERIYKYVDQMPVIGCDYYKYMAENLKYPKRAIKKKTQGTAAINFVVNEDGSISNVRNLNAIGDSCDEEAVRLISNMPKWMPGLEDGKPVKVFFNLPVCFNLEPSGHLPGVKGDASVHYKEQAPAAPFDMSTYLQKNLHYPDAAKKHDRPGRVVVNVGNVIVKFVINENGSVSDCIVVRGIGPELDEEALRVVRNMPLWLPGIQKDRPVKVYFTLPIPFKGDEQGFRSDKKQFISGDYVFNFAEKLDKRPSTDYDYVKYISEHVHYPDSARASKIQGDVKVRFIVKKDGTIGNCKIESSLGGGCDDEARMVVKSMPAWKPGISEKTPVNAEQIVTVPFYPSDTEKELAESAKVYHYVEEQPTCDYDVKKYFKENLKYPERAKELRQTGLVVVRFVVTESGTIDSVSVARGIGNGCDEEAVRLVKNMPKWNPGKQNGKPVKTFFTLPVDFHLTITSAEIAAEGQAAKDAIPKRKYNFLKYVRDSLKYPDAALRDSIGGEVIVKFSVDEDGRISDCSVEKGLGHGCDEEALRLVQNMPPWTPGIKDGRSTKKYFTQSITFDLDEYYRQLKKRKKS